MPTQKEIDDFAADSFARAQSAVVQDDTNTLKQPGAITRNRDIYISANGTISERPFAVAGAGAEGHSELSGSTFRKHLTSGSESANIDDRRGQPIPTSIIEDTFSGFAPTPMRLMTTTPTPVVPNDAGLQTLAYTILGENNSSVEGMLSVANVIHNRSTSGLFSNDPVTVALQSSQFSTWNDPTDGGNQENIQRLYPVGSEQYNVALGIATHVFVNNDMPDITGGSIMYHESSITPYWAPGATGAYGTIEIAGQTFYPTHPVPPMNIPSVATMLDVTPRDVSPTPGLVVKGNLDLNNRPQVMTPEGWATVRSIGIEEDGLEVLIPTVSHDGRVMTDEEAVNYYRQTGEHMGKFTNPWLANSYAVQVHDDQAKRLIELPRPRPVGSDAVEGAVQRFGGGSDLAMMNVTSTLGWSGDAPDKASSIFRYGPVAPDAIRTAAGEAYAGVDSRVYDLVAPSGIFDGVGQSVDWGKFTRDTALPLPAPPPLKVPAGNPKPDQQTVKIANNTKELHLPQAGAEALPHNVRAVTVRPDGTLVGEDGRALTSEDRKNSPTTAVSVEVPVRVTAEGLNVYERPTVHVDENGIPMTDSPTAWVTTVAHSAAGVAGSLGHMEAAGHTAAPQDPYSASLSPGKGIASYGTTDPGSIFYSPPAVREQKAAPIPPQVLASGSANAGGTKVSGSGAVKSQGGAIKTVPTPPEQMGLAPTLPLGAAPKAFRLGAVSDTGGGGTRVQGSAILVPKSVTPPPKPMPSTTTIMVRAPNPEYHSWLVAQGKATANGSATAHGSATLDGGVSRGTLGDLPNVGASAGWAAPPPPRTILVPKKIAAPPRSAPTPTAPSADQPVQLLTPSYVDRFGRPLTQVQTTRYDPETGRFLPYTRYEPVGHAPVTPGLQPGENFLNQQGQGTSGMTAGEVANSLRQEVFGSNHTGEFH